MINTIKEKGLKVNVGLTNDNYILEDNYKKYMVRVPKEDVKEIFNRQNEEQLLKQFTASSPTILPVYFDATGLQMTPYIENLKTFDQYHNEDRIEKVVNLMQSFHQAELYSSVSFDPLEKLKLYYQKSNSSFDFSPFQDLLTRVNKHQHDHPLIVCHNDWVEGNICFKDDDIYLIDFEYAANNHPYFDIMSFYTENDLSEAEKIEYLHRHFPHGITQKMMNDLIMYRDFNNLLWLMWARMMWTLRGDSIYKEIEAIKEKQLNDEFNKPLDY